jgi:hypothetical protein
VHRTGCHHSPHERTRMDEPMLAGRMRLDVGAAGPGMKSSAWGVMWSCFIRAFQSKTPSCRGAERALRDISRKNE